MALQTEMQGDFQERRREWQERGRCRQCGGDIIVIAGIRRCDECGLAFDQELTRDLVEPKPTTRLVPWAELARARGKQPPGIGEPVVVTTATVAPTGQPARVTKHSEEAAAEPDTMPRPVPWAVRAEEERRAKQAAGAAQDETLCDELTAAPLAARKRR